MKLKYYLLFVMIFSCGTKTDSYNINLEVKGLKKGKLVLKKIIDTSFVKLDSFIVNSGNKINFNIKSQDSEMLFIDLNLNDNSDIKTLNFFYEKNDINIITSLDNYGFEIKVSGSKNDSLYRDYIAINKKFNNQKLDLFQKTFENKNSNNLDSLKIIEKLVVNINKRQYLHNANFAVRNSNYELSPFIALTDLFDSKNMLDTIYKSLNTKIKNSKYGKELKSVID